MDERTIEMLAVLDECDWRVDLEDSRRITLLAPAGFERFWAAYQAACDALTELVPWRDPAEDPPPLNKPVALRIGNEIVQGRRVSGEDYRLAGLAPELNNILGGMVCGWHELPEGGAPNENSV